MIVVPQLSSNNKTAKKKNQWNLKTKNGMQIFRTDDQLKLA